MGTKAVTAVKATRIHTSFVEAVLDDDDEEDRIWVAIEGLPGSSWDIDELESLAEQLHQIAKKVRELRADQENQE
jgi:hypothetical protein